MTGDARGGSSKRRWAVRLCLLLAIGCTPEPRDQPLRLGLVVWPAYELGFLARQLELIPEGAVKIVDYESPAEVLRAYRYGLIDVVALPTIFMLELAAHDPDHRIVLVIDVSCGGDAVVAAPSIDSSAELRGKRLGVESTAMGALVTDRALATAGLTRDDVELVSVDIPDQAAAFRRGIVDAVVTYAPTSTELVAEGGVELWNSRTIAEEIVDVLVTRKEVVEKRGDQVDALVEGWLAALERLETHRADSIRRMAERERSTPAEFARALAVVCPVDRAHNLRLLAGSDPALAPPTRRLASWMIENELIATPPDLDLLFEPRFLAPDARPRR